jgi:8-oxo-dGTP pyrophosphatase MutT (NUDIX family)
MKEHKRYVGVLVKVGDKCLLCKRNKRGSFPGMWSVPAGKIEDGEGTRSAAVREFKEETDLDINPDILKFNGILPRQTRDGKHFKGLMFLYTYSTDEVLTPDLENAKDGEEHTECGYFTKDELENIETGEKMKKMLQKLM